MLEESAKDQFKSAALEKNEVLDDHSDQKVEDQAEDNLKPDQTEDQDIVSLKSTEAILDTDQEKLDHIPSNDKKEDDIPAQENQPTEQELNPTLASFMNACQKGELDTVKEMISLGKVNSMDTFTDGITGLHWASINNRLTVVEYLCTNEYSKADPNYSGGDLKATPLHWACRNGLVYIVDYLLTNTNADPSIRDAQSYNALHLAVHSSNITLVIYLLLTYSTNDSKNKLYIDEPDNANRTSLHWAAYQGDFLTIKALLKFGADVNKVDNSLFIPLHWAFIKGYKSVLKTLVEAGSDIFAKNDQGKNSFGVAKDMNCLPTWCKVLLETGRSPKRQWTIKEYWLKPKYGKIITFLTPYIILPLIFYTCSFSQGYVIPKLFLSILLFIGSIIFLLKFIIPTYLLDDKALFKTPFLAGIFSGTAFWTILVWAFQIFPTLIFKRFFTNILLSIIIVLFVWSFFKAMFINPGFVPTPSDNSVILEQVKDLIKLGKFDTDNFCVNTFIRKPLRSRFSKHNKKLVARFDHYCPWVYNEVGVRNHKLFMTFVYSLALAVIIFTNLSIKYFDVLEDLNGYESDDELKCSLLSEEFCIGYHHKPFHFNIMIWCLIQLIWITFLCVVQTFQICKGITTWEFSLLNNKIGNSFNHSTLPRDFNNNLQPSVSSHNHQHGKNSLLGMCAKLIGLDQFILTIKLTIASLFNKSQNSQTFTSLNGVDIPTDYGLKQNWSDFWFLGETKWRNVFYLPIEGENNLNGQVVDYYKLYELPPKYQAPEEA
ncbi:ankyrin [Hyphopichia burtonii NRRL Y-1933]|uniref:Palmitoyltransferase n=1 Tax=Hyphopichia burtonii NRRL Y-1933 TaxID=984485 RepID=A0A1E4RIJ9_9ASCO|nr:ankyrin [Hyphopichia burtonii NRRL Y-1933]ODV67098.1 ankyrin [Hyphopichia burtonii NRRL Y-1933]